MLLRLVSATTLAAASLACTAQVPPPNIANSYTPEYDRCTARAHGNTVQEGVCAQAELTRQDNRLNHNYIHLMNVYPPVDPRRTVLRSEERDWLKRRDTECKLNGSTVNNNCVLERTAARANELDARAHQK